VIRDRGWIAAHIPHQGRMCLLDAVEFFDQTRIRCSSRSHLLADNPLRAGGRLGAAAGVEYAAQAMAVHGALLAPEAARPRSGYLAALRGLELLAERLDAGDTPLQIDAERISGDERTALYAFSVACAGAVLLRGRATVVLDAALFDAGAAA
jgi:predicted hotdog family 3-hydroxylacyl-ACP dehydratase